jgi:hypothetical protein
MLKDWTHVYYKFQQNNYTTVRITLSSYVIARHLVQLYVSFLISIRTKCFWLASVILAMCCSMVIAHVRHNFIRNFWLSLIHLLICFLILTHDTVDVYWWSISQKTLPHPFNLSTLSLICPLVHTAMPMQKFPFSYKFHQFPSTLSPKLITYHWPSLVHSTNEAAMSVLPLVKWQS